MIRVTHAWLPGGLASDVVVEPDGRVRPGTAADPPAERGLLVPGLVNAHLHLELSWAAGRVPGGEGLPAWVDRLTSLPWPEVPLDPGPLVAAGTAAVSDVAGRVDAGPALAAAGLAGVAQRERLGFGRSDWPGRAAAAREPDQRYGAIVSRPSPHGVYSTAPELIRAACRAGGAPASIHLAEDPAEDALVRDGTGAFAAFLDRRGIDWRWWDPPGGSPAAYLDALGVLGPGLLCVHGVHLSPADRALLAARRSPLACCPRSNLHIGGALPDVPALLADGVAVCLGTDSQASAPDLDVLGELPVLAAAFPRVPLETWLHLVTAAGADALGLPGYGRIAPGATGGWVLLEVDEPRAVLDAAPPRRWVTRNRSPR
ncbi:MAG: amidohydrolase family protein [Myxococcota bacterium]